MNVSQLAAPLRRELLRCLIASSEERARLIEDLTNRNPTMADLLVDIEADDDLRARFEVELLTHTPVSGLDNS